MTKHRVDVENIMSLKNELNQLNKFEVDECEFWFDGLKVEIPKEEMDQWAFTGLNTVDYIMTKEWPDNPIFTTESIT